MSEVQLSMVREARRVGNPRALLELLDMATVLMDAGFPLDSVAEALDLPIQGHVTRSDRLKEALDISRAWPEPVLLKARRYGADWHSLREPARWWRNHKVEREEVVSFALDVIDRKGRWPRTDEFRRKFGFEAGHKGPADAPGQGVLPGGIRGH